MGKVIGRGSYCTVYEHDLNTVLMVGKIAQNRIKIAVLRYMGLIKDIAYNEDRFYAVITRLIPYEDWTESEKSELTTIAIALDSIVDKWIKFANGDKSRFYASILGQLYDLETSNDPTIPTIVKACASHIRTKILTGEIMVSCGILDHRDTFYAHKPLHTGNWLRDPISRQLYPVDLFNYK